MVMGIAHDIAVLTVGKMLPGNPKEPKADKFRCRGAGRSPLRAEETPWSWDGRPGLAGAAWLVLAGWGCGTASTSVWKLCAPR